MSSGTVLVVGATGGVGQAVAKRLRARGYDVVGTCRTAEQARGLIKSEVCHRSLRLQLDDEPGIAAAFRTLRRQGTRALAGVVNCAAITQPRPLELSPPRELRQTFEINVFGAMRVVQLALPLLRESGNGRVVFVSSTSGSMAVPLLGAYSASKFALEGLADVLRRELHPWKIGVSLVIPGGIRTPMIDQQLAAIDAELKRLKPGIEASYAHAYRQHRKLIELAEKSAVPPERVAADVERALIDEVAKARYLCGVPAKVTRSVRRLFPDLLLDRAFDRFPASKN